MTAFKHSNLKVYIPTDNKFNYKECKKLYKQSKKKLGDKRTFREVIEDSFFYSFFTENNTFIGCIYLYYEDNKLFLNGYANRHMPTIECMKLIPDWFNCDIYARSKQKPAIITLLKSGFKKIDNNLFKYERK